MRVTPAAGALPTFAELFGVEPSAFADAPGRVNLIGEHTDYNGGFVLPFVIPQRTRVEAVPREGRRVRLWSAQFPHHPPVVYELGTERPLADWADYVKGMTHVLGKQGAIHGFDARIDSDVPVGSGLSSSAALEIGMGRVLRSMFALSLDDVALAVAGRRAENEFVGAPVGIMDQMAASLGTFGSALFIDTRTLACKRIPMPDSASVIVIDSGISHQHAGGEYARRRRECADAAAALGVTELRDASAADLARLDGSREPLYRRARHVISENRRVLDAVDALRSADVQQVGRLFLESHMSMREDFEITVPEIDYLVDTAARADGIYGARMTGGGFGGSIVALAEPERAARAAVEVLDAYHRSTSHRGSVLMPLP